MNVCFYQPQAGLFNATKGGVARITRILKEELETMGVKVFFCTTIGESNKNYQEEGFFILPHATEDSNENRIALGQFLRTEKIDIFINQFAFSTPSLNLMEVVVSAKIKLVNAHHNCIRCLYEHYPFIFRTNRPKWQTKIVDVFGLWPLVKYSFIRESKKKWLRGINQSDAYVLYFESFKRELEELYALVSEKVKIITNPASFEACSVNDLNSVNKKIVYVGRIVENQKRIDKLLTLWKRLHDAFPDWTFDLVGDGSYMSNVRHFVEVHKLDRIVIHGFQDPLRFWKEGDIFTMTSDFEGFGMVLVEAQAMGAVPVVFDCFSAINEVIENGRTGIIIADYDEEKMFQEVCSLIENPEKLMQLKINGLGKVKDFDSKVIAGKWKTLFDSLAG